MSERATDEELAALAPLIDAIVRMIDPLTWASLCAARAAGAKVRVLVIPGVDVDVIALARTLRPMLADAGGIIDVTPSRPA